MISLKFQAILFLKLDFTTAKKYYKSFRMKSKSQLQLLTDLSKFWEIVEDRGAWSAAVHRVIELDKT